jgi:hypothetical protein
VSQQSYQWSKEMQNKEENTIKKFLSSSGKRISLIGGSFFLIGGLLMAIVLLLPQQVDASKLDTVTIIVKRVSDGPSATSSIIFQKTIHNPQKVQQIYQEITSLHQVKPGENYNCPAGLPTYNVFNMDFFQQSKVIVQATNSLTACAFWEIKGASDRNSNNYCCTSDTLWRQWHQELGIPAPYPNIHS